MFFSTLRKLLFCTSIGVLFAFPTTLFGARAVVKEWKAAHLVPKETSFDDLRFTNRSRCALDSKKPARSAFLLIDNIDVAKSIHRLANRIGGDRKSMTLKGIGTFRSAIVDMIELIEQGLFSGRLPLLPVIENEGGGRSKRTPKRYSRIMASCENTQYCADLDSYLESIWNVSMKKGARADSVRKKLRKVDSFDAKHGFIHLSGRRRDQPLPWDKNLYAAPGLSCRSVRKFSPLQAPLFGTKPDAGVLGSIALAAMKGQGNTGDCTDDIGPDQGLKAITLQFHLTGLKYVDWDKVGFDFWNSLNTYLSWAWRNAGELAKFSPPYAEIFKGVNIGDEIMFVPNGCYSILPPSCTHESISENMIREFAKRGFRKDRIDLDILKGLPDGGEQNMIDDAFTSVNTDILDLNQSEKAYEWVSHFMEGYRETRDVVRNRLRRGINFLNLVWKKMPPEKVRKDLRKDFKKRLAKAGGVHNDLPSDYKEELYYLCSEFYYAHDKEFSFARGKLALVDDLGMLDGIVDQISAATISEYYQYYANVGDQVLGFCNEINQDKIWSDDTDELDRSGQSFWYLEKALELKMRSTMRARAERLAAGRQPYLTYTQYSRTKRFDDVICATPLHCARKTLTALVNIYRSAQYVYAFWDLGNKVRSPDLFNPYSERTSCKVYDPWYKSKAVLFEFASGLGTAALAFANPALAFANTRLKPGRVVSFKQLVKEGKIYYDASMEEQKVEMGLIAELGPLVGVPCAVAVTRSPNPYQYLRFGGVGVNASACREDTTHLVVASSGSSIGDNTPSSNAQCLSCKLNFEGVAGSGATILPELGGPFFIAKALHRLYSMVRDPQNVPRNWKVNIHHVANTYRRFGEIPDRCVAPLLEGKQCLGDLSEEMMLELIAKKGIPGRIIKFRFFEGRAFATLDTCKQPIFFRMLYGRDSGGGGFVDDDNGHQPPQVDKKFRVPKVCRHLIGAAFK